MRLNPRTPSLLLALLFMSALAGCSGCERAVPPDSTPEDPVQTAVSAQRDKTYDVPDFSYPFPSAQEPKSLPEQFAKTGNRLIYSGSMTIDDPKNRPTVAVRIESGSEQKRILEGSASISPELREGTTYSYMLTVRSPLKPGSYRVLVQAFNRENGKQTLAEIPLVVR